jgi:hypothetical protein
MMDALAKDARAHQVALDHLAGLVEGMREGN